MIIIVIESEFTENTFACESHDLLRTRTIFNTHMRQFLTGRNIEKLTIENNIFM